MKLLIDSPLTYMTTLPPDMDEEFFGQYSEEFLYVESILQRFGLNYFMDVQEHGVFFKILPEKVCLDELDMNYLFSDILNQYFSFTLKYANLGGKGCELSLILTEAE